MATRSAGILSRRLLLTRQGARHVAVGATLASVLVALALWAVLLQGVDPGKSSNLGLISALPPTIVVPFGLLLASFAFCIRRMPHNTPILLLHAIALIVMLYGVRGMIDQVPAFKVTWRHIGIADVINRTGEIDPTIDAYFNWPGFFTLFAFLARIAGFSSIEPFAAWAPVFFNLLYLAPLLVIMRTATKDSRVVWVAILTFYLTNWIGQDYLSPQALAFFLHLVVIALVLRWFTRTGDPDLPDASGIRLKAMLMVVTLVITAFAIPSHQLTPFATVAALAALLLCRRLVARGLPVIITVMTGTWLVLVATDYLSGHQKNVTGGIGDIGGTLTNNVGVRITGNVPRLLVLDLRLLTTVVVWLLALFGAWRLHRNRRLDRAFAAVAVSAFPLIALQSYGGEVLLRVYLFTLPFAAFFIASAIFPTPASRRSPAAPFVVFVLSVLALVGFAITRYGNERIDYFTPNEVSAIRFVYANAPPTQSSGDGSRRQKFLMLAGSDNLPWESARYEQCACSTVTKLPGWESMRLATPNPAPAIMNARDLMRRYERAGAYMIFTRSTKAAVDLIGASPKGSLANFEVAVAQSKYFRRVYANPDAEVFVLSAPGRKAGT